MNLLNTSLQPLTNRVCSRVVLVVSATVFGVLGFQSLAIAQDNPLDGRSQDSTVTLTPTEIGLIKSFGPWPMPIPPDPGNELSGLAWAEALGRQLFHDTDLSGGRDLSCASCHVSEFGLAENLKTSKGAKQHVRNSQSLLNAGLQHWFGWDGGADSLWAASLRPMLSDIEMNADIPVVAKRYRAKPVIKQSLAHYTDIDELSDEAFVVLLSKAIAAHTRTLVSGITPFDRYRQALLDNDKDSQANYPDAAKRGLKIFMGEANCHVCHFGADFSNGEFHDTGRPFFTDVGQIDSGRYSGIKRVRQDPYNLLGRYNGTQQDTERRKTQTVKLGQGNFGQWRTPSLRNLALTAPYTHDGSLPTLRSVVDAYADIDPARLHSQGESLLKPLDLDDAAREDLVQFLESLSETVSD